MGSVRTSILGRPRPLPRHRHAELRYTLNCEEPPNGPGPASKGRTWTGSSELRFRSLLKSAWR